jgi:PAS domain S-box-containing protein
VILLDVVMPGMDGFEVCQKLKSDPVTRDIPVVFITALKEDKESRIRALEVGAEAFLAKPIDETELTAQIRAMVKIKAANDQKRGEKEVLAQRVLEQTRELTQAHNATLRLLEDLHNENEARKKNEIALSESHAALQESESFAHATVDALSAHLAILDEKGTIIAVNHAWRTFAERNSSNVDNLCEGINYLTVCDTARGLDSKEANSFAVGIRSKLRGELDEFIIEYPCHSPDEKRWFIGRITRFNSKGHTNLVITHENITERKLAEEALRESEAKFTKVFHDAPVWIAITDWNDETYLDVNEEALRATGYSREEVIGHTAPEFGWLNADGRAQLLAEIQKYGRISGMEMIFRTKDGRSLNGWVNGEQIIIGSRPCLLTITVNITDHKQLIELRRWYSAMLGREERTLELKKEVNDLLAQAGRPPRYAGSLEAQRDE